MSWLNHGVVLKIDVSVLLNTHNTCFKNLVGKNTITILNLKMCVSEPEVASSSIRRYFNVSIEFS